MSKKDRIFIAGKPFFKVAKHLAAYLSSSYSRTGRISEHFLNPDCLCKFKAEQLIYPPYKELKWYFNQLSKIGNHSFSFSSFFFFQRLDSEKDAMQEFGSERSWVQVLGLGKYFKFFRLPFLQL